jgi:hypothetical protein
MFRDSLLLRETPISAENILLKGQEMSKRVN